MIKPHANLCPLNQSVDSMSPNTWEQPLRALLFGQMMCCILPDLVQIDELFLIFWLSNSSSSLACAWTCTQRFIEGLQMFFHVFSGCLRGMACDWTRLWQCCRRLSWLFGRSAWVLVMIKPHANLCPLNQSVDSMSPNTWEHFSSGKWRVAFCLTLFRLIDCSWNWCCPFQVIYTYI